MTDIPLPEPTPTPRRDAGLLHRLQPFLTLVIALAAIALAIWEGAENRRHNRLSVQPRIGAAINSGRDSGGEFARMTIESTGLGPAVIGAFRVYLDGVLQESEARPGTGLWNDVIAAFDTGATQINAHSVGRGYYLPVGRQQLLFELRRPASDSSLQALSSSLDRLALQVCYCSVYGTDCDEVLLTTRPIRPAACER